MPYQGKYNPEREDAYKLSRSKVQFFLDCKRCFYLDRRLSVKRPPGFPFNLNSAVDSLLKNEFDYFRKKQQPHPYIKSIGINAVPFQHEMIEKWRQNFVGVSCLHKETNLHLFGAVDDIWINSGDRLIVEPKIGEGSCSKVGQKHVAFRDESKRNISSCIRFQFESHASL